MNHTPDLPAPTGSPFDGIRRVTPEGREYVSGPGRSRSIDRTDLAAVPQRAHRASQQLSQQPPSSPHPPTAEAAYCPELG